MHNKHIAQAQAHATRLAEEAAEATEDGIRDLIDEDAEADTAIRAAIVRQMSTSAMQAFRRLTELEAAGDALAFGRITGRAMSPHLERAAGADPDDEEELYIGRLSVLDGDEALLVDWRAAAAAPFYQATPVDRMGVHHRRHLQYGEGTADEPAPLIGYSDEVFDLAEVDAPQTLRGEAAILASLEAPTEAQMKTVVATIQAEQDRIIRAPANGALVVQGGPGTGKTVVALHRAAYLLYNQRSALAENGVLIVGPTSEFLSYISGVLPSLGETGVVSVTANQLFGNIRLGGTNPPGVSELKGRAEMATLLAKAVSDRQRLPTEDLVAWYGSDRVKVRARDLAAAFEIAQRFRTHNDGAEAFRRRVIEAFVAQVHNESFGNWEDAFRTFSASRPIRLFMLRHWPTLTAEQALNDLFGSPALLRLAGVGSGLTRAEVESLRRERTPEAELDNFRWTEADVPLLDELHALLGLIGENQDEARIRERDEETEFELAEAADERGDAEDDDEEDDGDAAAVTAPDPEVVPEGFGMLDTSSPILDKLDVESVARGDAQSGRVWGHRVGGIDE